MALVNLLRFSKTSGGIVADEGFWNIFFRRRNHGDNLHRLLTDEMASAWNMEVVLGTVGYPSVHQELLGETRADMASRHAKGEKPEGVREVARVVFEALQRAVRRRIDQKLRFWFGFESADLHRGYYEKNGEKIPLGNETVKEAARAQAKGSKRDRLLTSVFDARAAVFGFDPLYGVTAFYLSPENAICGYVHEGFDCIGTGKYASGLSLGLDFNAKTMMMRKAGYPPAEGVYELLRSSVLGVDHFKETAGTLHLALLDADAEPGRRYREIFDERARLAGEVVRASMGEMLERETAVALLEKIVFQEAPLDQAEGEMFDQASDALALQFLLRGYKKKEAPLCARRVREARDGQGT